jgi:Na+/proline symporter
VIYFFGLVIGQDIWQRVFTARSDAVARWAGATAGFYCLLYAAAGALIGMAAEVILPNLTDRDDAYPSIVQNVLLGGMLWKRGTIVGALASIITGTVLTLGTMVIVGDIYANSPIFVGLIGSLVAYVVGSLLSKPTSERIRAEWDRRITSERHYVAPVADETTSVA